MRFWPSEQADKRPATFVESRGFKNVADFWSFLRDAQIEIGKAGNG